METCDSQSFTATLAFKKSKFTYRRAYSLFFFLPFSRTRVFVGISLLLALRFSSLILVCNFGFVIVLQLLMSPLVLLVPLAYTIVRSPQLNVPLSLS